MKIVTVIDTEDIGETNYKRIMNGDYAVNDEEIYQQRGALVRAVRKNIPLDKFLDDAYEDFCELESGESYIIINGVEHSTDVGYAMEGIGLFIDFIKECLLDEVTKSYCDTCERSSTCANRSDDTRWCSHYVNSHYIRRPTDAEI